MAELVGAILGTALFNALAFALTKFWPMSVGKIFALSGIMIVVLTLGDNAVRNEPIEYSFFRVLVGQIVVLIYLLATFQSKKAKAE